MSFETPEHLHYTKAHAWLDRSVDPVVVGITDYAQSQLGDLVFVDLPSVGDSVTRGEPAVELESSKTVDQLVSPVTGTIAAVNNALDDDPALVNRDPYGQGWIIKVSAKDADDSNPTLISAADYSAYVKSL